MFVLPAFLRNYEGARGAWSDARCDTAGLARTRLSRNFANKRKEEKGKDGSNGNKAPDPVGQRLLERADWALLASLVLAAVDDNSLKCKNALIRMALSTRYGRGT